MQDFRFCEKQLSEVIRLPGLRFDGQCWSGGWLSGCCDWFGFPARFHQLGSTIVLVAGVGSGSFVQC